MTNHELLSVLTNAKDHFETEILEFKEADNRFKVRDLGTYFSALSNEANLRGAPHALLVFGVTDKGEVAGTSFYREPGFPEVPSKGLQRLKKQVAENTNNRITFREIHEFEHEGRRIVAFEIPPATRGIPTQWAGAAWAREGESLVPLPLSKIDEIRAQPPADWGKQVVAEATIADLDSDAIDAIRESMRSKYAERAGLIDALDDGELLDKAGITLRGSVTNAALLLLGRPESATLMDGPVPRISWTLYEADGHARAYEHFDPPFALTIDDVLTKIRNERYRIMHSPDSLVPAEIREYDPWTLRELMGNALAHQDYAAGRRINVGEYPDRISVSNAGAFIPGTLARALQVGYKPSYYRNPFLCDAMLRAGMLDQDALGIRTMCEHARTRKMPLPTYDVDDGTTVEVTLANHEISPVYTAILVAMPDIPMQTLLALDLVQKGLPLAREQQEDLLARSLARMGEDGIVLVAPSARASSSSSGTTLSEAILALLTDGPKTRVQIARELEFKVSGRNPGDRVYRALKRLEADGKVVGTGSTRARLWSLG